jgi:hypothetical protein
MSVPKKCDIRDRQSDRLRVVEQRHDSAMRCANPHCSKELLYFRAGTLQLLEFQPHSDELSRRDDGAFVIKGLISRFFWLCGDCSKTHISSNGQPSDWLGCLRILNLIPVRLRVTYIDIEAGFGARPSPLDLGGAEVSRVCGRSHKVWLREPTGSSVVAPAEAKFCLGALPPPFLHMPYRPPFSVSALTAAARLDFDGARPSWCRTAGVDGTI